MGRDLAGEHVVCSGCGRTAVGPQGDPTDVEPSSHCGDCPPWTCATCGETDSAASPCPCWASLEGMPLADVKGLMAGIGLSVESA